MRTPARPRLPDGDCVFISDARIVARAVFAGADCAWPAVDSSMVATGW